jgi:hypothetical protein
MWSVICLVQWYTVTARASRGTYQTYSTLPIIEETPEGNLPNRLSVTDRTGWIAGDPLSLSLSLCQ